MRTLLIAVQFLTRLPVPVQDATEREVGRSVRWFSFVGVLVGCILLGGYLIFSGFFPIVVARVLTLVVLILVSGALHLDGLGDTVDGFYAGKNREDALRIMKDPHIGAIGVVAIVTVLLMKAAVMVTLPESLFRGAVLLVPAIGRGAMVFALVLPYARPSGLGKVFVDHRSSADIVAALAFLFCVSFGVLKFVGLGALLVGIVSAAILVSLAWYKIRGVTGDICGAVNEVAETGFLLALSALAPVSFAPVERVLPEAFWRWHL